MSPEDEKKKRRGFFNLFGGDEGIESIDELFEHMHEEMLERMEQARGTRLNMDEGEIKRLSQNPNMRVYGYSMRVGPDGKPQIREFGNVKPQQGPGGVIMHGGEEGRPPQKSEPTEEREPLVDLFSSGGKTTVVAELPGVAEEDIEISLGGKRLEISVDKGERKYFREVELPKKFDKKKMKKTYNNGVLELVFS